MKTVHFARWRNCLYAGLAALAVFPCISAAGINVWVDCFEPTPPNCAGPAQEVETYTGIDDKIDCVYDCDGDFCWEVHVTRERWRINGVWKIVCTGATANTCCPSEDATDPYSPCDCKQGGP